MSEQASRSQEKGVTQCEEDHREFREATCPGCRLEVDFYGNTEAIFKYCCFPDCGCDGARLCMTGSPNNASMVMNIERGSWK